MRRVNSGPRAVFLPRTRTYGEQNRKRWENFVSRKYSDCNFTDHTAREHSAESMFHVLRCAVGETRYRSARSTVVGGLSIGRQPSPTCRNGVTGSIRFGDNQSRFGLGNQENSEDLTIAGWTRALQNGRQKCSQVFGEIGGKRGFEPDFRRLLKPVESCCS